ncbi:MAG TPA: hypothetical protein VHS78_12545 [Candidatus Elarobacter sp.]|nr:hypothetical protein [Candidatus Elarobacter sp.]
MQPVISHDEIRDHIEELAPGVRLRITNIPTVVRTGGHEPGTRLYYSIGTAEHLSHLRELGRLRMARGETEIVLDFSEDAAPGRAAYNERLRREREGSRKYYEQRMRRVPRYGSSDYLYERLHPAPPAAAEGEHVSG